MELSRRELECTVGFNREEIDSTTEGKVCSLLALIYHKGGAWYS